MATQSREFAKPATRILVTHRDPDIDDVEAIRLLMQYGEKRFPGVSDADIVTTADREPYNQGYERLERRGIVCVGVAGGPFDEHPFNGKPRKEGECATTLVAKELGLYKDRALQSNIQYAYDKNYGSNTGEFEIAPLVKLAFRFLTHTGDEEADARMTRKIFQAAFMFLNAAEEHERSKTGPTEPTGHVVRTMDEYVALWLLETVRPEKPAMTNEFVELAKRSGKSLTRTIAKELGVLDDPAFKWIIDYADMNQRHIEELTGYLYDLKSLVMLAQKHFCVGESAKQMRRKIGKSVGILLTAVHMKDKNFHVNCRQDFYSPSTLMETVRTATREIRIVSVLSENPEMQKFARSREGCSATVVIQRRKTGNTVIFFNQAAKLDPKPVVAGIRTAERQANGITEHLDYSSLTAQGSIEGAEVWYFDGFQMMNGSLTTNQQPTKLSRNQVDAIVLKAMRNQF